MNKYDESAYTDPSVEISDESVFIWVDIFNFSGEVENVGNYRKLASALKDFQKRFQGLQNCNAKIISDGIILEIKEPTLIVITNVFSELAKLQYEFIVKHSYFLRGGIATGSRFGELGTEDAALVSNGLSRAAKLEGKSVNWPIIATTSGYIEEINRIKQTSYTTEDLGLCKTFNANGDEIFFINFISHPDNDFERILRFNINKNKDSVRLKYIWLWKYYYNKFSDLESADFLKLREQFKGYVL